MTYSSQQKPQWSQQQAIAYEAAQEAINKLIALYMGRLYALKKNNAGNNIESDNLKGAVAELFELKDSLDAADDDQVTHVRRYCRATIRQEG